MLEGAEEMSITTEETERLAERLSNDAEAPQSARYQPYTDHAMCNAAAALRSLAAERDALRAERNAEVGHRLKAEGALFNMERRIARHRRVLAKLYRKRHDRNAENAQLREATDAAARALHKAGEQFAFYANQHAVKGTADGDKKAATNQQWAQRCFNAHDAALGEEE